MTPLLLAGHEVGIPLCTVQMQWWQSTMCLLFCTVFGQHAELFRFVSSMSTGSHASAHITRTTCARRSEVKIRREQCPYVQRLHPYINSLLLACLRRFGRSGADLLCVLLLYAVRYKLFVAVRGVGSKARSRASLI
jgi:hypothetical protein